MKQVNRKFLEEQVKKSLQEQRDPTGISGTLVRKRARKIVQNAKQNERELPFYIDEFFFGARKSRETLMTATVDLFKYGWGPNSHVKKALDEVKNLTAFEALAFRFMVSAAPGESEDVAITFNVPLFNRLYQIIDNSAKQLVQQKNKKSESGILKVIKNFIQKKIYDDLFDDYGIATGGSSEIEKRVDSYSVKNETRQKAAFRASDSDCSTWTKEVLEKPRLTENQAKNFLNKIFCQTLYALRDGSRNPSGQPITHTADFAEQIASSNVSNIVAATFVADYSRSIEWDDLAIAFTDFAVSTIGTISLFFTFGASSGVKWVSTLGLNAMTATVRKSFGSKALATNLRKSYEKVGKFMTAGKTRVESSAFLGGTWKGSILHLIIGLIPAFEIVSRELTNRLARLDQFNEAYFGLLEKNKISKDGLGSFDYTTGQLSNIWNNLTKSEKQLKKIADKQNQEKLANTVTLTGVEKQETLNALLVGSSIFGISAGADIISIWEEIYDALIDYNYKYLQHAGQIQLATKVFNEGVRTKEDQLKKIKQAYLKGDKTKIQEYTSAIQNMVNMINGQVEELKKQKSNIERTGNALDNEDSKIKQAEKKLTTELELISKLPTSVIKAKQEKLSAQGKSLRFGPTGTKAVTEPASDQGDIPTSFGSDEKTSSEIYDEIVAAFSNAVNEQTAKLDPGQGGGQQTSNNKIKVNLGYKDALEFSKGTEGFSVENTVENIRKIRSFLQSKGKEVSFTPIVYYGGSQQEVDQQKFKSFAKEINTELKSKKLSKMTEPVDTPEEKKENPQIYITGKAAEYYPLFKKYSEQYNMNLPLMLGICHRESDFDANAVSHTKDYGLMQINISNFKGLGLTKNNVFDPETNIKTGIAFFSKIRNEEMPRYFKKYKSIIKWEDLTEVDKDRFAMYGYNWGTGGLFYYRKPHKYKDLNKFYAMMKRYYKNYSYIDKKTGKRKYVPMEDYSIKAINFAKKYGYGGSAVDILPLTDDQIIIVGDSNAAGMVYYGKYKGKLKYKRDYVFGLKGWSKGGAIYVDPETREPLEPAIGAYTTTQILQKLKKFYEFKGEDYKPSIAVVHMGYNDLSNAPTIGFDNIQKAVNFLRSKGVSDVRVILTKGRNTKIDRNFKAHMQQLSDRLQNELTGAKIIPNNAKLSKDGVHFFGYYEKLYREALGGIPSTGGTIRRKSATKASIVPTTAQKKSKGKAPAKKPEPPVTTPQMAIKKLNTRVATISKIENFQELIERFQILYGTSISKVLGGLIQLEKYVENLQQEDLSNHRKAKFTELIDNVHKRNRDKAKKKLSTTAYGKIYFDRHGRIYSSNVYSSYRACRSPK